MVLGSSGEQGVSERGAGAARGEGEGRPAFFFLRTRTGDAQVFGDLRGFHHEAQGSCGPTPADGGIKGEAMLRVTLVLFKFKKQQWEERGRGGGEVVSISQEERTVG